MQFNDVTNENGLVQDVLSLCSTTTASYGIKQITRNINQAYHDVNRLIWEVDGAWQFDDSNKSDLPIGTTDLVDAQQDYEMPSNAQRIERIEVLDNNSDYQKLEQMDYHDIDTQAMSEFRETDALPVYYDLIGRSVFLYPAPSEDYTTLSSGLKIYFDRDVTEFSSTATTATPGFATPFHRILSYSAAIDFEEDTESKRFFQFQKDRLEEAIKRFYSSRNIERQTRIRPENKRRWRQYL